MNNKNYIYIILALVTLSCTANKQIPPVERTWEVASTYIDCEGVNSQKCLQVRTPDGNWEPFYGTIKDFNFQEGYTYTIKVTETTVSKPLADGSSKAYTLKNILSQRRESSLADGIEEFRGNYKVAQLNKQDVSKEGLTILIDRKKRTISGFSGCNTYSLNFKQKRYNLRFAQVYSTERYCEESARLEKEFLITYILGDRFTLEGDILTIFDGDQELLVAKRFEL